MEITKEILFSKRPLTLNKVIEALDSKRQGSTSTSASVKTEDKALKAFTRNYPVCSNGRHNPNTKHKESKCRELKKASMCKNKANIAEVPAESASINSQSSSGAFVCIRKAMSIRMPPDKAILDSGASHHMFNNKDKLFDFCKQKTDVQIADGKSLQVEGDGFAYLKTIDGSSIKIKVLYVPCLTGTLISLGRLLQN